MAAETAAIVDINHAHAFERLGIHPEQTNLRLVENEVVKQEDVANNPRRHPSPQELAVMLGRTYVPFYATLMRWFTLDAEGSQRSHISIVQPPGQPASSSQAAPAGVGQ